MVVVMMSVRRCSSGEAGEDGDNGDGDDGDTGKADNRIVKYQQIVTWSW